MIAALCNVMTLLGQVTTQQTTTAPESPGGLFGGGNSNLLWIGLLLAMIVFIFLSGRGRRREQKERETMLEQLAKNARVITFGGIMGVITDVKDDEITIKVDEQSNTKLKMKKWAVRTVVPRDGEEPSDRK